LAGKVRCMWRSTKPGRRYFPVTSITVVPVGTVTALRGPTVRIRDPSIRMAALGIGAAPVPSIRVAPTKATRVAGGWAADHPNGRNIATVVTSSLRLMRSFSVPDLPWRQPSRSKAT
jgi:hypothetical protein